MITEIYLLDIWKFLSTRVSISGLQIPNATPQHPLSEPSGQIQLC